jgi:hypothetical protein
VLSCLKAASCLGESSTQPPPWSVKDPLTKVLLGFSLCAQRESLGGRTDFFTSWWVKVVLVRSLSCSFGVKGWEVLLRGFL